MHITVDSIIASRPVFPNFGEVAEWSKALLVRENKQKLKRSQVRPPTWAPLKKKKKRNS